MNPSYKFEYLFLNLSILADSIVDQESSFSLLLSSLMGCPPNVFSMVSLLLTSERFSPTIWPLTYCESVFKQVNINSLFSFYKWSSQKIKMQVLIFTIWSLSSVWAFLPLLASLFDCNLFLSTWYVYGILYGFYSSPIVIILSLHAVIIFNLWRQEARIKNCLSIECRSEREKTNMNITLTIIIIGMCLILSYIPNIIWWQMDFHSSSNNIYPIFSAISNILQVFNSAVNPAVYAVLLKEFRNSFKKHLTFHCF